MINYEEKYLKYKTKYLELKNSIGSGNTQSNTDIINKKMEDIHRLNYYILKKKEYFKNLEKYNSCVEYNKKIGYFSTKQKCILPKDPQTSFDLGNYYEEKAKEKKYTEIPDNTYGKIVYRAFFKYDST